MQHIEGLNSLVDIEWHNRDSCAKKKKYIFHDRRSFQQSLPKVEQTAAGTTQSNLLRLFTHEAGDLLPLLVKKMPHTFQKSLSNFCKALFFLPP